MAAPAPRLTRSSAAMQPKVSPAVAFLSSTPVVEDDEDSETDESFDPTLDDSFLSDDEPDAVITSEQVKYVGRLAVSRLHSLTMIYLNPCQPQHTQEQAHLRL